MKKFREIKKFTTEEIITGVWCNNCGEEIQNGLDEPLTSDGMNCLRFKTIMTYGSPKDGDIYEYHLCYGCFDKIIDNFKIKPTITEGF